MIYTYFLYKKLFVKYKEKYQDEILQLANDLIQDSEKSKKWYLYGYHFFTKRLLYTIIFKSKIYFLLYVSHHASQSIFTSLALQ